MWPSLQVTPNYSGLKKTTADCEELQKVLSWPKINPNIAYELIESELMNQERELGVVVVTLIV